MASDHTTESHGPLAKRTRELLKSEAGDPLRSNPWTADPNALSTVPLNPDSDKMSSSSSLSGRRPRAGTLPSTFSLSTTPVKPIQPDSYSLRRLSSSPLDSKLSLEEKPRSKEAVSSVATSDFTFAPSPAMTDLAAESSSGRLHSDSLSMASSGLATASVFAPNGFDSNTVWGHPSGSVNARSRTSSGASAKAENHVYGDSDSHVRTLDYLGLDNDSSSGSRYSAFNNNGNSTLIRDNAGGRQMLLNSAEAEAPGMKRLGSIGSTHLMADMMSLTPAQQSRMRAQTIAIFPRSGQEVYQPQNSSSFSLANTGHDRRPSGESFVYHIGAGAGVGGVGAGSMHHSSLSSDSTRILYSSSTSQDDLDSDVPIVHTLRPALATVHDSPSRARAATMGVLDRNHDTVIRRRAGTASGLTPHALLKGMQHPGIGLDVDLNYHSNSDVSRAITRSMRDLTMSHDDASCWGVSRSRTPEIVSLTPPHQQPTRSLWIGNLDPSTTPAELQAVFAPYGPIESLRLIPEKECGFVNFVSVSDAIHAKEDVLSRLGGQLTKSSGMVRIGFGKADTSPVLPFSAFTQGRASTNSSGSAAGSSSIQGMINTADSFSQPTPSRALWIGSIPSSTTPNQLMSIFLPFGPIESARVLSHKSCGFINFEHEKDAMAARKTLNGVEIMGPEVGGVRIGFAKEPTKLSNEDHARQIEKMDEGAADLQDLRLVNGENSQSAQYHLLVKDINSDKASATPILAVVERGNSYEVEDGGKLETSRASSADVQAIMRELSGDELGTEADVQAVGKPRPPATYYNTIPQAAMIDPSLIRRYSNTDAQRLRDIRKRLDGLISTEEVDSIAYELLDDCVSLSSDYIGNTVIQKLFERASVHGRKAMLERIAPHLATVGTHKNGTWAVQKIIQCVKTAEEFSMIERNVQPFTPPLLVNDFGNYVVQGALRFGSPSSDFIFDAMVDRCWEIGSGRFGARSMRQTLESPLASRFNVKRVAVSIIVNAIPFATSANGALLITWLLDASNLPGRYQLLAPRFAPHIVQLCCHKLASNVVLKVVNQRADLSSALTLLNAIFFSDSKILETILCDQSHGVGCVTKIISGSFMEDEQREKILERVRPILVSLNAQSIPAYRKLVEDAGLVCQSPPVVQPMFDSRATSYSSRNTSNGWRPALKSDRSYTPYMQSSAYPQPLTPYSPYGHDMSHSTASYPYHASPLSNYVAYNSNFHSKGNGQRGINQPSPFSGPPPTSVPTSFSPLPQNSPSFGMDFPPSPNSDPLSSLRINTGEAVLGAFNPAFSPYMKNFPYGNEYQNTFDRQHYQVPQQLSQANS